MVRVEVKGAVDELGKAFKHLDKATVALASSRAINKSILLGRTMARTAVKGQYNIPQRYMKGIGNINARPSYLIGCITASAKPIPMDAFSPTFSFLTGTTTKTSRRGVQSTKLGTKGRKGTGVTIEVRKGEKENIAFAFMLPTLTGRIFGRGTYRDGNAFGFVQRHTHQAGPNGNDAVKPLLSVTVHAAVINPKVEKAIGAMLIPAFSRIYTQQLQRLIDAM
jgi:hypothetical protein